VLLFAYRTGDSNMCSVWLCTRNDALGNIAVLLAAFGVMTTCAGWPDILVAAAMAFLSFTSATQVVKQARSELASA
jgi:Co/Zn/Cd efflux system component